MRTVRTLALAAVACLALGAGSARAAWNNVFQACCHSCRSGQPSTSYLAPVAAPVVANACPQPCPTPVVPQTSYVQRSYYQPVISYKTTTYYEPVTTMQTSYYYEGYTAYKSTSFYDPCTGCCKSALTPYTAYRLRSQCNAVQSYVQRNALTPVTNYQQMTYYEPVTTYVPACPTPCSNTTPIVAAPAAPAAPAPAASDPGATLPPISVPPAATESKAPPLANPGPGAAERQLEQPGSYRKPVALKPSRVAAFAPAGTLQGQLVARDYVTPRGNSEVRFVNTRREREESVTTDATGKFSVNLPAGEWQVYLTGSDGQPVYHSRVEVRDGEKRDVLVVGR